MTHILPVASMSEGDGGPHVQRYFRYGAVQVSCRLDSQVPVTMAVRADFAAMTTDDLRDLHRITGEALAWVERVERAAESVAATRDIARRTALDATGRDAGRAAA